MCRLKNNQGVALIIVLLITTLLIALIFEFAYGTRVSLRAATNYRDSQRAYFLARSGVNYFKANTQVKEYLPHGEWGIVPIVSDSTTELKIRWEDEVGRIRVTDLKTNSVNQALVKTLFSNKGIDRTVADRMADNSSTIDKVGLLSELHRFMSDADYNKVSMFLTVSPIGNININTASEDVLLSFGISQHAVGLIIEDRKKGKFSDQTSITNYYGIQGVKIGTTEVSSYLTFTSNISKVYSYATVGGYTKQIESIVGTSPPYWKAL
jgi:type II secretory pathway component PulK